MVNVLLLISPLKYLWKWRWCCSVIGSVRRSWNCWRMMGVETLCLEKSISIKHSEGKRVNYHGDNDEILCILKKKINGMTKVSEWEMNSQSHTSCLKTSRWFGSKYWQSLPSHNLWNGLLIVQTMLIINERDTSKMPRKRKMERRTFETMTLLFWFHRLVWISTANNPPFF